MIRIAVIGAGHMGRLHATKIAELSAAGEPISLAGVVDIHPERARSVAAIANAPSGCELEPFLEKSDALIVAAPTAVHAQLATQALEAGCHVLVEKPVAGSLEAAERLTSLARRSGRVLQVGHLEWFGPAMRALEGRVGVPRFVEAHRLGPFPRRSTDVDVVRDLMIHDLDIVQQWVGAEPERVEAVGVPVLSESADIANARLVFPDGCVANLTASRVSTYPLRKLRVFQREGYLSIDFLAPAVTVAIRGVDAEGARHVSASALAVPPGDALLEELRAFARAVRAGSPLPPQAPGSAETAVAALRTAFRVIDAMPAVDAPG